MPARPVHGDTGLHGVRLPVVNGNPLDPDGVEELLAGLRGNSVELVQAANPASGVELLPDSRQGNQAASPALAL